MLRMMVIVRVLGIIKHIRSSMLPDDIVSMLHYVNNYDLICLCVA